MLFLIKLSHSSTVTLFSLTGSRSLNFLGGLNSTVVAAVVLSWTRGLWPGGAPVRLHQRLQAVSQTIPKTGAQDHGNTQERAQVGDACASARLVPLFSAWLCDSGGGASLPRQQKAAREQVWRCLLFKFRSSWKRIGTCDMMANPGCPCKSCTCTNHHENLL